MVYSLYNTLKEKAESSFKTSANGERERDLTKDTEICVVQTSKARSRVCFVTNT